MTISQNTKIIEPVNVAKQIYYELTPERLAVLDLIAYTEGTDKEIGKTKKGYNILFGFETFTIGKDHPRKHIPFGKTTSTAAGRYQFLDKTWDAIQKHFRNSGLQPFPSFEPIYQDQAALYLIDGVRKAMSAVDSRDIDTFLEKCSYEWASIPDRTGKGRYGQPVVNVANIKNVYNELFDLWNA